MKSNLQINKIDIKGDIDNLYFAGAALKDGELFTSGGRVLGITAIADSLKGAIDKAYEQAKYVDFKDAYYRKDIGARALKALEE